MFFTPRTTSYRIQLVRTRSEGQAADRLVRRMYAWRGYSMLPSLYRSNDSDQATLAVWQDDEVAATLTIGRDSTEGLLADALYAPELASLRQPGRVVCEVTRLAVRSGCSSEKMMNDLFRTTLLLGKERFGGSDAVIEVNPRHVRFYERRFGFYQIGKQRQCPRVNAPAVLLHQTLEGLVVHGVADYPQGIPEDWTGQQLLAEAV